MPRNLKISDVIDKNKVASGNAWLILLDIQVRDALGEDVEMLHVVKNNENVVFRGETYIATEFSIDFDEAANTEPTMKLRIEDVTGSIRNRMEDHEGGVGSSATIIIINSDSMDSEPEIEETFDVVSASAPDYVVEWSLGAENPLRFPFPYREQYRDRCPWIFKGRRCQYVGAATSCDYTLNGPNGCREKGNVQKFGGFPSLRRS